MPLRTLLLTSVLLFSQTFAADRGCFDFFPGSYKIIGGHPSFAVGVNRFVSMKCPDRKKVVAHDRFRGICLFEERASKPLYLSDAKPPLYICPDKTESKHPIRTYPVSVYAGELAKRPGHEGALFSGCCRLAGIFDGEGRWFDAEAIRRLLEGDTSHSDVGARFAEKKIGVVVDSVDPFAGSGLMPGDKILKAGSFDHPSLRKTRELVDGCRVGERLTFGVERNGKSVSVEAPCFDRRGGGVLSDTFLERFGMHFSKSLRISEIDTSSISYKKGLRVGDRLLMIDGKPVGGEAEVREVLSGYAVQKRTPENMLWEREGFQFFLLPTSL
ncbi:hypothetical protein NNO_2005 [Hydrogenimonas sp.]|nr:hypothetical protein NNO_2005 [Hydrogenimonas sp.]